MRRLLVAAVAAAVAVGGFAPAARAQTKDTPLATYTRTKKLKGKVTVDFKNEFLKETLNEISSQIEEQKLGPIKVEYAQGVSQNTRVTFAAKNVTVEEALDGLFKQLDLGYVVVSNSTSRADGYLRILKGPNRGYETGQEPKDAPAATAAKPDPKGPAAKPDPKAVATKPEPKKPEEPKKVEEAKKPEPAPAPAADPEDEKMAGMKLALAKNLIADGKADRAKIQLTFVVKKYPGTKAAAEAKELLDKKDEK